MDITQQSFLFSVSKELFSSIVLKTEKITGKTLSLPILSNILFEVKNKKLTVRATNLDIGIEALLPIKVSGEGSVAVPAHILSNLLNTLNSSVKTVTCTIENGNMTISADGIVTVIKCVSPEEFPILPIVSDGQSFSLEGKKLVLGIQSVVYAASVSDIKPELASVYIYPEHDDIVFVATDSFRLAEKKIKEKNTINWGGVLIPFRNAQELIRIFEDIDGGIDVRFNDHQIVMEHEGIYVTSRIIHGSFPDYYQIIPKEYTTTAIILKNDLLNAFKISGVVANTFRQTTLLVNPKQKTFTIETKNADVGSSIIPIQTSLTGEEITINVNYKYITDAFSSITTDSLHLAFSGKGRPIVITPIG